MLSLCRIRVVKTSGKKSVNFNKKAFKVTKSRYIELRVWI